MHEDKKNLCIAPSPNPSLSSLWSSDIHDSLGYMGTLPSSWAETEADWRSGDPRASGFLWGHCLRQRSHEHR